MDGFDKLTTDDRFELLSAYVDDELTLSEQKQVESWLASDPEMMKQYRALSAVSRSFQSMPAPQKVSSADDMLEAVFSEVERKPRLLKMAGLTTAIVAGIGALGALFVGPIVSPQMARENSQDASPNVSSPIQTLVPPSNGVESGDIESVDTDSLMLVLDAPPVDIPIVSDNTSFPGSAGTR